MVTARLTKLHEDHNGIRINGWNCERGDSFERLSSIVTGKKKLEDVNFRIMIGKKRLQNVVKTKWLSLK